MTDIQKQLAEALEDLHLNASEAMKTGGWVPTALHASFWESMANAQGVLAAHRQQEARRPLTLPELAKARATAGVNPDDYPDDVLIEPIVRAVEAAHGIKGD